jgi:hypothetical protein
MVMPKDSSLPAGWVPEPARLPAGWVPEACAARVTGRIIEITPAVPDHAGADR